MARVLVADNAGIPWAEILTDDGYGPATFCLPCRWRADLRPSDPIADHVVAAVTHVDQRHQP